MDTPSDMQTQSTPPPRFEGFVMEVDPVAGEAAVRAAVAAVLGDGWDVRRFGEDQTDYELLNAAVQLDPREAWQRAYALRAAPGVRYAEPVFAVAIENRDDWVAPSALEDGLEGAIGNLCFDDPWLPESDDPEWSLKLAKVDRAWARFFPDSAGPPAAGIVIGHPDTGYRRHPEIEPNLLIDRGWDFVDGDNDAQDELQAGFLLNPWHGTGTSSVIISPRGGAAGATGKAVSGVAPGTKVIPLRVARSVILLVSTFNLAHAIEYAADHGAHVISMSLGGVFNYRLRKAVVYAQRRGVIVLAAAGNCVRFVVWPAAYDEVIAVAACNAQRRTWRGSCRGSAVDVTAPGEAVWRASVGDGGALVAAPGTGTSFAVATTAGIAALWLARHGRDQLIQTYGAAQIPAIFHQLLRETCVPVDDPSWEPGNFGAGLVDAEALLAAPLPDGLESAVEGAPDVWEHAPVDSGALPTFDHLFEQSLRTGASGLESAQPGTLEAQLADLLNTTEEELPAQLQHVGQELAFHLATQPELYRQFEAGLTARAAGPGLESAPTVEVETLRASLAGVGASDDLRARLAGAP